MARDIPKSCIRSNLLHHDASEIEHGIESIDRSHCNQSVLQETQNYGGSARVTHQWLIVLGSHSRAVVAIFSVGNTEVS